MPTLAKQRFENVMVSQQIINGASYPTLANVEVYRSSKTTPFTVRRPKPTDLFAEGTSRLVMSYQALSHKPKRTLVSFSSQNNLFGYSYFVGSVDALQRNEGLRPTAFGDLTLADNKLLNKIKNQKTNLTVSIPELGKTTDMVANLARDVWKSFHNLRSGRPLRDFIMKLQSPRNSSSKRLAKRWLELQYGWIPTMHDVYGLSEMITNRILAGEPVYVEAKTSDRLKFQSPDYFYTPDSQDLIVVKARARYVVDSSGLKSLSESGITNPALTIYELIPYSFVLDWVIDMSSFLSTLDALVGVKDLIVIRSCYFSRMEQQFGHRDYYTIDKGEAWLRERITRRLSPSGTVRPVMPSFDPSIGVKRMISAAALLRTLR